MICQPPVDSVIWCAFSPTTSIVEGSIRSQSFARPKLDTRYSTKTTRPRPDPFPSFSICFNRMPSSTKSILRVLDGGRSPEAPVTSSAPKLRSGRTYWRCLLWMEWQTHAKLLLFFLLFWLAMVWLLPLVAHPLWILAIGPAFAIFAGPAFGGADVLDGCEEWTFTFPPTRSERFAGRWLLGGSFLLLLSGINILALEGNLSDILLRVFVSSGLPAVQPTEPLLLYGLVFAAPFTVFAIGFTGSALATSRTLVLTSWVWGVLGALSLLRGGVLLEEARWSRFNGLISVPLLICVSFALLWVGSRFYARKEAVTSTVPIRIPWSGWALLLGVLLAGVGVALLLAWFTEHFFRLL